MPILHPIKLYRFAILVVFCLAVLYLGPLKPDYTNQAQWTGYLGAGLLIGAWALARLVKKQAIATTPISPAMFGLLAAFLIATAFSLNPRPSASVAAQIVFYGLAFTMVADLMRSGWERQAWTNALLWASGLVSFLTLLEVLFWFLSWYNLGGAAHPWPPFNYRVTSWVGHANIYAAIIIGVTPLAVVQGLQDRRIWVRLSLAAWAAMAVVNLIFASSRGGWLVLGGTLALLGLGLAYIRIRQGEWSPKIRLPRIDWKLTGGILIGLVILSGVGFVAIRMLRNPTHIPLFQSRMGYWPVAWRMFTASPLIGYGPDSYYRFWIANLSITQSSLATNPVNVYLALAAETGIAGLGIFLLAIGILARQVLRAFKSASPADQLWLAACASGVAGMLVHGVTEITAVLYPAVLFLIILLALLSTSGAVVPRRTPAWMPLSLLVLVLFFGAYVSRGQIVFAQAVQAGKSGDWQQAAELAEKAAGQDPEFAWYPLQAGYAHGMAALTAPGKPDPAQLQLAIQDYQKGIALEPAYPLNYANLAALYWQAGDTQSAAAQMGTAIQHDPGGYVYTLNMGWMQESLNNRQRANDLYVQALNAYPGLADTTFWQTSATRQAALKQWQASSGWQPSSLEQSIAAMDAAALANAKQSYAQARSANPFAPVPYLELGLVAWRNNDLPSAEYYMNVSVRAFGDFTDRYTRINALLDLGNLAAAQDQNDKAIAWGLQAFNLIDQYNVPGPGSYGSNSYANLVFHRDSLPGDVLPALIRPDMSTELAESLVTLGDRLLANAQTNDACHVYRRVLISVPDLASASTAVKEHCTTSGN